jgi:1-acyl-sn-glycerol-3-phosphate acyltransferase
MRSFGGHAAALAARDRPDHDPKPNEDFRGGRQAGSPGGEGGRIGSRPAEQRSDGLTWREDARLLGLWLACRLFQLPVYAVAAALLRHWGGYRIADLAGVRARFQAIARERRPLLICANHLTCIDSALIIWALGSNLWYLRNFSSLSWNLPAWDFFGRRPLFRLFALVSKCIFLDRKGPGRHKRQVFRMCRRLLLKGEVVTIFPEGRRSRTGRFEPAALRSGVGRLIAAVGRCNVLCVHLRADAQANHSDYPPKGALFFVDLELLELDPPRDVRDRARGMTRQVAATIAAQEARFFETRAHRMAGRQEHAPIPRAPSPDR